jgi:hypothetical protein
MGIIYADTEERSVSRHPVDYYKLNAVKHFMTHYNNAKILQLIVSKSPDRRERAQATKELAKADKKMEYWRRHPNWNPYEAGIETAKVDKQWRNNNGADLIGKTGAH